MVRFNTRMKKPKLYHELVILGITLLLAAAAIIFGGDWGTRLVSLIMAVFFLVTVFVFFQMFRKQMQYNPYSYNTIFYFGFALFLLYIAIQFILATVYCFKEPEIYDNVLDLTSILRNSASSFMLYTSPFILAFSIALFVSNISLIRHERKRIQNLLGMILAVLLVAGEVFLFFFNYSFSGSLEELIRHDMIVNLFAAIYLYFECMIIGAMVAGWLCSGYKPDPDADYIIILGCRVAPDGKPYPLLRGRIEKALEFYRNQLQETGKAAIFIPSGGKGSDEIVSECQCMKNYLMEQGVPEEHIIEENRAENTYENMKFSKEIIMSRDPDAKILFSTTNYHVFRSGLMARRLKMRAIGIGASTKWYFWPNAAVREFVGLLQGHKIKQAIIFGGLLAAYAAMTIILYHIY